MSIAVKPAPDRTLKAWPKAWPKRTQTGRIRSGQTMQAKALLKRLGL